MGLEWPRDVGCDERVAPAESCMLAELFLNLGEGGVLPQASCYLSAVFHRKQTEVAVALLEHEVVCLPDLFWGGLEVLPGICEARLEEGCFCSIDWLVGVASRELGEGGFPRALHSEKESCSRCRFFL